jgi:chromosome segregation ATPase
MSEGRKTMNLQKLIDEIADERRRVKGLCDAADARTEKLARLARELEASFDDLDEPELTFEEKQERARFDRLVELSNEAGRRVSDLRWRLDELKKAQNGLEGALEALDPPWRRRKSRSQQV